MHLSLISIGKTAGQVNAAAGSIYSPEFLSGREIPIKNSWIRDAVRLEPARDSGEEETEISQLQIFLTEEGEEALRAYTHTDDRFPMTLSADPFFSVDAQMTGDRSSFILEIPDPEENYVETVRHALSSGGFEKSALARCEFQTEWEKAGTENSGEYQCGAEDFEGDTVTLSFGKEDLGVFTEAVYDEVFKENDRPGKTASLLVLRQRLDSLKVPYAVGFSKSDRGVIHLRFPAGSITRLESELLFAKNEIRLRSTWGYVDKTFYNADTLSFRFDAGNLIMESDSALKELSAESFHAASRNKDPLVDVFLGGRKIGRFSAADAADGPISSISFPAPSYKGTGAEKEKQDSLARLMTAVLQKGFDSAQNLSYYRLYEVEYRRQDGETDWARSLPEELPDFTVSVDMGWKEYLQETVLEKGGELEFYNEDTDSVQAFVLLSDLDVEDLASAGTDLLKTVWNDPGCGVSRGELRRLSIDCTENTGGRHAAGNYTLRMSLPIVPENHRMELEKPEVYLDTSDWTYDSVMVNDESDPIRTAVTDRLAEDDFLKEFP